MSNEENTNEGDLDYGRSREVSMWSNSDSCVASRSTSTVDRSSFNIYPKVKQDVDRTAYKQQKYCIVCETQVGKHGITKAKKLCCKFCFNAVCANCSPLTLMHPETHILERVCMTCFYASIEDKMKIAGESDIKQKIEQEIQEKNMIIARKKLCENKISDLEDLLNEKSKQENDLIREIQNCKKKMTSKIDDEEKLKKLSETVKDVREINILEEIQTLERENSDLKEKIERAAAFQASQRSGACCLIQ
ncbi:unnamed protein product [Blepharisma stoltei]|uniref:FYVE-type domain-containing protein n=1 Tax=Blepharisma stoltei TaxID=1481888 RepID=A0AAU9IVV9_9CILI|nr:unnamed protein product [Blepharisma stoltei]